MNLTLECERETDGRWLAEVPELPGVLAYGSSAAEALAKAEVLALRVLADRIEHGDAEPTPVSIRLPAAA
jgi:predicted RNase H-like HicB family nuclease